MVILIWQLTRSPNYIITLNISVYTEAKFDDMHISQVITVIQGFILIKFLHYKYLCIYESG